MIKDMTQEDMPNIREIMDKSFEAGYKDAMDFAYMKHKELEEYE